MAGSQQGVTNIDPLAPGSGKSLTDAVLQNSQGTEIQSGAQMMQNFIRGRATDQLTDLVGSEENLSELTDTITRIINGGTQISNGNSLIQGIDQLLQQEKTIRPQIIVKTRDYYNQEYSLAVFDASFVNPDISANINDMSRNVITYLEDISKNFYTINNIYNDADYSKDIITNLLNMKQKVLFDTVSNIHDYEKRYNLDLRKNLYDFERNTIYDNVYDIMRIIYYAIFVVYILFGNFMKEQLYKSPFFYGVASVYLLFPFTLKYIFAGIIYIYEWILGLFGIHNKVLSYNDIIQANNIENIYTSPVPSSLTKKQMNDGYREFVENSTNSSLGFII